MPANEICLGIDEVHVWRAFLDNDQRGSSIDCVKILSNDEKERATRFFFQEDRDKYVIRRAMLRRILSCYLRVDPQEICFRYGHYGKPRLADEFSERPLHFNMSHSGNLAMYAFSRGGELGIDVERIDEKVEVDLLAQRFFSSEETERIRTLSEEERRISFFDSWVRKEAYLKAMGTGLSVPVDSFELPRQVLGRNMEDRVDTTSWFSHSLTVDTHYASALVVQGSSYKISLWQYP